MPGPSTERFDIFIERPTDTSPAGRERLVRAMATRFGIEDRLLRGPLSIGRRLRAKANVDEAQAAKIVRELEALGAIVTVSKATGTAPRVSQEMPLISTRPNPAVATGTPGEGFAPLPSLTLATLDGEDAEPPPPPPLSAELAAPPAPLPPPPAGLPRPPTAPSTQRPAVAAPSTQRPAVAAPSTQRPAVTFTTPGEPSVGRNAFEPPPSENDAPLELAIMPSRPGTMAPPAPSLDPPSAPRNSKSAKAVPVPDPLPRDSADRTVVRPSIVELATGDPRGRFVAGLALGLALGFLPAHVYASFAEEKLDDIGLALAREPAPQTEAEFQLLMQQFDLAEGRSRRVKARIMVIAGAIWLLGGAGAAYGYWRIMESRQLARDARGA